ncbi:hypothetical protein D9Q98_009089 [Chlorella vulgaris]|uniref:EGF-like domain-containing protein n=1 Tax=Chlorella vulgaris TaxID=3077 RepID=A0A9D4TH74_CHLVU|nr:hypothetical protein D9Q98_009089 [Chlorella vulgaris]
MTIVRRQEQRRIPLWLVPLGALLCVGCGGVAWQLGIASDVWTSSQGPETESAAAKAVAASLAKAVGAAADRSSLTDAIKQRCQGTLGTWCTDFWTQAEVPAVTAPRGNHTCSMDCNKVGTCSALTGRCTCPAGWRGFNCVQPMKRHCANRWREWGFEAPRFEADLGAGVGGSDMGMFPRTHCAGYCEDTTATCYCPSNTTFGHIPAAPEDPLGSPPVQLGRLMPMYCQPNKLPDGTPTAWGTNEPAAIFGPEGWCMAAEPQLQCECVLDGIGGPNCDQQYEHFCMNQCNGRGECNLGYCKCDPGWHGIDCAHRSATADASAPGREASRPWIAEHVHTPAAQDYPPQATRKHPLIYVYDLPSDYSTLMLQYRYWGQDCVSRWFELPDNRTELASNWVYLLETALVEMLLQSEHRTLDPEEADFFYVPVFVSCFAYPVRDMADSIPDFFYGQGHNRAHGQTNMLLEAYHWIRSHHPWWDRRGGRDHVWLSTHDEGSCLIPAAIRPSIILSHWGRMDATHKSDTGYWMDVYSAEFKHPHWEPDGFLRKLGKWPCYDPVKDLIMPLPKRPEHYHLSPLVGAPARNRTWLAFHRGRVQPGNPGYSRGIRQSLAKAAEKGGWLEKHKIVMGEYDLMPGDYSELLASSVFCLVLPGDGWTARMDDATLHGCIPVIIMDNVHVSFESIIDVTQFSIRVPQADLEKLPEILQAVPQARREEMQRALTRVWQRFTYSSYRPYAKRFREEMTVV